MARRNETIIEILYNSPWWVSVVASALAYGVLQYIAPSLSFKNPLLQGIPGLDPIFAPWVALILLIPAPFSFLKSLKKRKLLDKQRGIESIRSLSWKKLEELVGEAYRRQGYSVLENEGAGPDGGVDLWLEKNGNRYLVQCKHWRSQKVGVNVVREMFGLVTAHHAFGAIVITSGLFTQEAKTFAHDKPLDLVEGQQLVALIDRVKTGLKVRNDTVTLPLENNLTKALCPACGAEMVLRTAKKGNNAGQQFWGCSNYPRCKGTRALV